VKPKFKLQWTKRDQPTYPASGGIYEEMFKFFAKKNAAREE